MNAVSRSTTLDELAVRLHQQELVAKFGQFALSSPCLNSTLNQASSLAAKGLGTDKAKVLRYRPESLDFLIVAGVGWRPGVVGTATLRGGSDSPAGHALLTGEPVLASNLEAESRFRVPSLLAEHAVRSAISVVIGPVDDGVFGVLEADSTDRHDFAAADTLFLQSIANTLAGTIARTVAAEANERKLRELDLLMKEIHHRVKNSLQLVQNMLQLQARGASQEARPHLEQAAIRIKTVGSVHHRLYAGPSVEHVDAAEFLRELLADMQFMLAGAASIEDVALEAPSMALPASTATSLGLVVTELVTNAVKYGVRPISVKVEATPAGLLVTVEDSGKGFPPNFTPSGGAGLGMRLIATLANPAPGSITVDRSARGGRVSVLLKP